MRENENFDYLGYSVLLERLSINLQVVINLKKAHEELDKLTEKIVQQSILLTKASAQLISSRNEGQLDHAQNLQNYNIVDQEFQIATAELNNTSSFIRENFQKYSNAITILEGNFPRLKNVAVEYIGDNDEKRTKTTDWNNFVNSLNTWEDLLEENNLAVFLEMKHSFPTIYDIAKNEDILSPRMFSDSSTSRTPTPPRHGGQEEVNIGREKLIWEVLFL